MLHNYPKFYKRINNKASTYFTIVYNLLKKNLNSVSELDFDN